MTKRSPEVRGHEVVKQAVPRGSGRKAVGRVGKRGRGRNRGCELVPVVEKLRPGQLKAGRGGRGGRGGVKTVPSPKRVTRRGKTTPTVSSVPVEERGVRGEVCEVNGEGRESESNRGGSDMDGETEKKEKCGMVITRGDGLRERDEEEKQDTELPIGIHVPKLRRSHATVISLEAMLTKDIAPESVTGMDVLASSNDREQCNTLDTSSDKPLRKRAAKPSTEMTGMKRRRGRPRKTPRQKEDMPALQSSTVSRSSATEEVDAALHSVPTPTQLSMLTQLLTTPVPTTTNLSLDVQTSDATSEPSTMEDITEQSRELSEEYPQPSTYYQKMQRKLAREKQLSEMRAREMALEREKRFLRRQGVLEPEKKRDEGQKKVKWKEERDLVEVFLYSPCSSRGSTLEPDEIPDIVDPT